MSGLKSGGGRFGFASRWVPRGARRLLDVGCSSGYYTEQFGDRAEQLYGADPDEEALAEGAEEQPEIGFVCCDGARLAFRDQSFEVVLLMDVVEHVAQADRDRMVDEAHRVLEPGGLLILTTVHAGAFAWLDPMDFKRRCPRLYRLYMRLSGYRPDTAPEIGHRHLSAAELAGLLGERFEVLEREYSGLLLVPCTQWCRAVLGRLRLLPGFLERFLHGLGGLEERLSFGRASYFVRLAARKGRTPVLP